MSMEGRLEGLRRKHRELDNKILEATRTPGADELEVKEMKKEKLRIKEEISALSA